MASFNLIDEPWIPCVARGSVVDLGFREAFARAHEIDEIADPSPLVTLALHRLLLAVGHRVFGPENGDAWAELRERGRWDMSQLDRYFTEWRDRFDLFSATHPFFQAADLDVPTEKLDAYKLVLELGTSNTPMFSGVAADDPPTLTLPETARGLISIQPFHRTGRVGDKSGPGNVPGEAGPLAEACVCLLTGSSLFETLLLNMVDYSENEGLPFRGRGVDRPVWEREEPPNDVARLPDGYLDWLTWISWIARVVPENMDGRDTVRRARIVRGNRLPKGQQENTFETMVGYSISNERGFQPVRLRQERAVWRDSAALFQSTQTGERPKIVSQLSERVEDAGLERRATIPLSTYGVVFHQANALLWRNDRLPLPLAFLDDESLYGKLRTALGLAEGSANGLRYAGRVLAAHLLRIDPDKKHDRKTQEKLRSRVTSLGAERRYWATLDTSFSRFLVDQAAGSETALGEWAQQVLGAARSAFEAAALALPPDGNSLRIKVQARGRLEGKLAKTQRDHPVPPTQRKEAV